MFKEEGEMIQDSKELAWEHISLMKNKDIETQKSRSAHLTINIELLRLTGYIGFWMLVFIGFVLTILFGEHGDPPYPKEHPEEALLHKVFGYNNICIYFDYAPANYVLPALWAVDLAIWELYFLTYWLRMRAQFAEGKLNCIQYSFLSTLVGMITLIFLGFSTIFAVTPRAADMTLYVHTLFFFFMQTGISCLAMVNILHGTWSGYYSKQLKLPRKFVYGAYVYLTLMAGCTCFKIPVSTLAMINYDAKTNTPWKTSKEFDMIAFIIDRLWLLLAAIIPLIFIGYLLIARYISLDRLEIHATTSAEKYRIINSCNHGEDVTSKAHIHIGLEKIRFLGYLSFWVLFGVAYFLTRTLSVAAKGTVDGDAIVLPRMFGYKGVDSFFSFSASSYILPFAWAITLSFWFLVLAGTLLRASIHKLEGILTELDHKLLTILHALIVIAMISFSAVFAVSIKGGEDARSLHKWLILAVQAAITGLSVSNVYHGLRSGRFDKLRIPYYSPTPAVVYLSVLIVSTFVKVFGVLTFSLYDEYHFSSQLKLGINTSVILVDTLWFIFAGILPVLLSAYILFTRSGQLERLHFHAAGETESFAIIPQSRSKELDSLSLV